jgi:surface polysaccharide O-acyltransferase-like enzyme
VCGRFPDSPKKMNDTKEYSSVRLAEVDIMRALAISAVVLTHSVDPLQKAFGAVPAWWWWTAVTYLSVTRFCVPLFFMLSGYTLLGKDEPLPVFYKKRAVKILGPYLAWSIFYFALRFTIGEKTLTFSGIVKELATGTAYFHLWFIYAIAGIYVVTPFVRRAVRRTWSAGALTLALLLYTAVVWAYGPPPYAPLFTKYLGYFVFGFYVRSWKQSRLCIIAAVCMILAGAAFGVYYTYLLTSAYGAYNGHIFDYTSPFVIMLSAGVFLLMRNLDYGRIKQHIPRFVFQISIASYGTYLMHPVILSVLQHNPHGLAGYGLGLDTLLAYPVFSIPVAAALAIAVCTSAVLAMRRIPIFCYIV